MDSLPHAFEVHGVLDHDGAEAGPFRGGPPDDQDPPFRADQVLSRQLDRPGRGVGDPKLGVFEMSFTIIGHLESRSPEDRAHERGDALILGPESTASQPIILTTGMIMSEETSLEADVIVFDRANDVGSRLLSTSTL